MFALFACSFKLRVLSRKQVGPKQALAEQHNLGKSQQLPLRTLSTQTPKRVQGLRLRV